MKSTYSLIVFFTFLVAITSQCMTNYQYTDSNTGLCMPCNYNCLTCFNNVTCTQCMPQFYLENNACSKCSFGCSVCNNATICSTCNNGLYLTNAGTCSACTSGVATCTIATIQSCQSGYFLLSTICAGCFSNCMTCTDFVTCSTCNSGYYLASNATSCLLCPSNCLICTDSTSCSMCKIGYTQSASGCALFNCSSIDQFCISCANGACLACQTGKYLQGGKCLQGASLLCLEANGSDYTSCITSDYGCQTYSQIQNDTNGNQLPVCLPQSASKFEEYIYASMPTYTCMGSCSTSNTISLGYQTTQAYYQLKYYLNIKFYGNVAIRLLTISLASSNGSSLESVTQSIDISQEIGAFSQTDANCLGCIFGQKIISGSFSYSGGQYSTNLTVTDSKGQIQIVEAMY